jgi:hypothetical protein
MSSHIVKAVRVVSVKDGKETLRLLYRDPTTVKTLPFSALEKIKPDLTDATHFLIKLEKTGRQYGVKKEDWLELDKDELVYAAKYGRRRGEENAPSPL